MLATCENTTRDSQIPIENGNWVMERTLGVYHTICAKPTTSGIETNENSTDATIVSTA